jgi:cation transport ATPase
MGRGAEQAKATASVILLEDRLQLLPEAISAARHSMRVMNQNLAAITVANLAGLVAAVATPLQPALAALISNGTTLAAAANGLRPLVHDAIRVTSTVRR